MIKRSPVFIGLFLFLILGLGVGGFFLRHKNLTPGAAPQIPLSLPDIALKNVDGRDVRLSDFSAAGGGSASGGRGKPLVIILWASWCSLCKDQLRQYFTVQKEFSGRGEIVFLAINRAESAAQVQSIAQELGIASSSSLLLDYNDALYRKLGGFSMPETLFMDQDGVIQERQRGPMVVEELRRHIQARLP
jgi:thiol-disulfide isomerase/thioredoxin